jgi:hemerythrin-like domain-containing protein
MSSTLLTNVQDVAQQIHVESSLMKSLIDGLRAILGWKVQGDDFSRKRSTVTFVSKSLRRHLERLMSLEETGGYMDIVLETKPNLGSKVDRLRQEHERFRHAGKRIARHFEQLAATDHDAFDGICGELAELLDRLERHGQREAVLFQEAFKQEEGGEG